MLNFNTETLYTGKGETKISFQSLNKVYKVRVPETLVIAPIMVTDDPCRVQEDLNLEDIEGVVESGGRLEVRYSSGVLGKAVTVENGLFAVLYYFILRQLRRKWLPILPSQRLMFNRSTAQILA